MELRIFYERSTLKECNLFVGDGVIEIESFKPKAEEADPSKVEERPTGLKY